MKKHILDLTISDISYLNANYILMRLTSINLLPEIVPGQFAQVKVEGSQTTFLRRPISISFVDRERNELWFLIQIVGDGTKKLSELKKNDNLNIVAPLGNGFTLPQKKDSNTLLIGGGVGVAPMLIFGEYLHRLGYKCSFLLGARTDKDLLLLNEFEKYGIIHTTTEDGSHGEKGFVTQHSILQKDKIDQIYTCGPTPMMRAVAQYANDRDIFCEVSLENMMGCGIGACLCCVTDTTDGHLCVCSDGPIFNIKRLKWQI